jgi:hypothetical protein
MDRTGTARDGASPMELRSILPSPMPGLFPEP